MYGQKYYKIQNVWNAEKFRVSCKYFWQ